MPPNGLPLHSLALEPAIDQHFRSVSPETNLVDVLALLSQLRSSCQLPDGDSCPVDEVADCLLVQSSQFLGVFTDRDVVRLIAAGVSLENVKVADVISPSTVTLKRSQAQDIFTALGLIRQYRIRYLPIVDDEGQPIGIVTHESIRRALQPVNLLTRLRYVREVMTTQVIQAPTDTSILKLAQLMSEYRVSCVVIREEVESDLLDAPFSIHQSLYKPVGIVTERDIVQFLTLELDLNRIPATTVMSTPLFCLRPDDSLWTAHQEMQQHHVKRMVVAGDRGELLGIISQTSLLQVLSPVDMYGVIEALQQAVEQRTSELEQTNNRLRHEIFERLRAEAALRIAHDDLKQTVEKRTAQLRHANEQLQNDIQERERVEAALRESEAQSRMQRDQLEIALQELQHAQSQLIQTEKMSSLGQLVAGVAHEINNPINFIYGNLTYAGQYVESLLRLLRLYAQHYPNPSPEIIEEAEAIDLEFLEADLPKLLGSMKVGANRIRDLVLSLRNFSRLDEAETKLANLHEGLESTLLILHNRLKPKVLAGGIEVIKEYGELPLVECLVRQLNQVFMNLILNAIDALEEKMTLNAHHVPTIWIRTGLNSDRTHIIIRIADNGIGMTETVQRRLFDPFFTTKAVGKGTGLGLSISYQIVVEKHGGQLHYLSTSGQGAEFIIELPIRQQKHSNNKPSAISKSLSPLPTEVRSAETS